MSCDLVYNCAVCFKTVKGKQHYAICVSCSCRVHRKCYGGRLSNTDWTTIRQMFTCATCEARSRGQRFNSSYCSDGERQLVIEQSIEKTLGVFEILIGASIRGGDIVRDGSGYTYGFSKDYPCLRVWECTFRGCWTVGLKHLLTAEAIAFLLEATGVSFLRQFRSWMARKSSWRIRVWDSNSRSEIARCRTMQRRVGWSRRYRSRVAWSGWRTSLVR